MEICKNAMLFEAEFCKMASKASFFNGCNMYDAMLHIFEVPEHRDCRHRFLQTI